VSRRRADVERLYQLLAVLTEHVGVYRMLRDCTGRDGWPSHGVYFFFEPDEVRADGTLRLVRIGTHALTQQSRTTLWTRLSQHRGPVHGGGNHRTSVFRHHLGAALIRRAGGPDALVGAWLNRHRSAAWATAEADVEREVSRYICGMPFLWLSVPNRSDGTSDRGYVERNCIALLSGCGGSTNEPTPGWLGHHAVSEKVRASGLWNVHHVDDRDYDPRVLATIESLIWA
jgi:hypothetical protein